MAHKAADRIRNVALIGHRGSGKTSLTEALLFEAGVINRLGRVGEGTTVADFEPDEQEREMSIGASVVSFEYGDRKINLIDTPGEPSFVADTLAALRVAAQWASVRYSRVLLRLTSLPPDAGLGTIPQGGVAIALGLSFVFTYGLQGPAAGDPIVTTIVLGVAAAQLLAPSLMKRARTGPAAGAVTPALPAPGAPLTHRTAPPELSANAPAEWRQ